MPAPFYNKTTKNTYMPHLTKINSKRKFLIVFLDGNHPVIEENFTLNDILEDVTDWEYIYALREMMDEILDLKQGDALPFQANRDNKNSLGIIKRIA